MGKMKRVDGAPKSKKGQEVSEKEIKAKVKEVQERRKKRKKYGKAVSWAVLDSREQEVKGQKKRKIKSKDATKKGKK